MNNSVLQIAGHGSWNLLTNGKLVIQTTPGGFAHLVSCCSCGWKEQNAESLKRCFLKAKAKGKGQ